MMARRVLPLVLWALALAMPAAPLRAQTATLETATAAATGAGAASARGEPGASGEGAGEPAVIAQDDLYLAALKALNDGRPDEAAALLARLIEREPRHAGAWLDLAISKCELGQAAEAERLFKETERQFNPPPAIIEVIARHRASGCPGLQLRPSTWTVNLGLGHDSNVNQGPSSNRFDSAIGNIELAPEFMPQADYYTALAADYYKPLDHQGTLAIVQLRAHMNQRIHQQDSSSLLTGVERPWQWGRWRAVANASVGWVRLHDALYQRQAQLLWRLMPPLPLPEHFDLALVAAYSHVEYPTRIQYDANSGELGAMLSYRGARAQVQLALGVLDDHGRAARPGGDRQGWYTSLQWQHRLSDKTSVELGLNHQDWRSEQPYLQDIINQVRHQATDSARLAGLFTVRPHQTLLVEWRATRNRENISLLQYNSNTVQLSWRWDNY